MAVNMDKIFVNVPVKDLKKSMALFTAMGFEFNAQFTDEKAACLVIGEHIFAMLLVEDFFKAYTKKEIADATRSTEAILGLAADSRAQVDELVDKALAAGGTISTDPYDHGFMYGRSFEDIDGHIWEVFYMDASAVNPE
ncbi:extradiol dioxygenase [Paenibacillus pectinilyticus]|uniref:Extradiol dioxygenase n=1 Tax=Paenibacillus pectinilyticus TaxID=512399 RepID=A0A1C0ZTV1_9BACL|nr:VOC family protein [Paenibacillus pectinilyticus]OCT11501.1 extradiol dioxygenase [Paenibacillus pectinilyticus]